MSTPAGIDWDQAKRTIGACRPGLEPGRGADDRARCEQVYGARARQFAARCTAAAEASNAWPALVFTVGTERMCMAVDVLAEVLPCLRCAAIPGAPPALLGVINVRGRICSVLDLGLILELPAPGRHAAGYIVLMRHAGMEVGLRVDEVDQVRLVSLETRTLPAGGLVPGQYLRGLTSDRLSVLDPQKIVLHPIFTTDSLQ